MTPTNATLTNTSLKSGSLITWTQFPTHGASQGGRERTGRFWALAPGTGAIWVCPSSREPGEPVAIKVYRKMHKATASFEAVAYDDDLTAQAA